MAEPRRARRAGFLRVNGIVVLCCLVVGGFGAGALYYSFAEPRARRALAQELAQAPTTAEGRVAKWMEYAAPQAHHKLTVFARVSKEHPWIVTHVVEDGAGEPVVHGIDVSDVPHDLLRREGMTVVLDLARPTALGRARLGGDSALHIPHVDRDLPREQADRRLHEVVSFLLDDLVRALPRDIEGARFEIRVGGGG